MKRIQLLLLALLIGASTGVYAQQDNEQQPPQGAPARPGDKNGPRHHGPRELKLAGIWQQVQRNSADQTLVYLPVWRVMQGDGHFLSFVIAKPNAPAFLIMEGNFHSAKRDGLFLQRIHKSLTNPELEGLEIPIEYVLIEPNLMEIRYMIPSQDKPIVESWERIQMKVPEGVK